MFTDKIKGRDKPPLIEKGGSFTKRLPPIFQKDSSVSVFLKERYQFYLLWIFD